MQSLSVKAFAKINLSLEVKGKQPDGYHEIETLLHGIALHDTVELCKTDGGIQLILDGGAPEMPEGSENLAWQAADLLSRTYPGKTGGVRIRLTKRIPVAAGLGGGSADAAAVLLGLDRLYDLGLGKPALEGLAARLGSDVAFCLSPLAAVGRGRGERLEAVTPGISLWILLVKPPFGLTAREVYGAWRAPDAASADLRHADVRQSRLLQGIRDNEPRLVLDNMFNDLEEPAISLEKRLPVYKTWIREEAANCSVDSKCRVMLCGSGSTLAVFFTEEQLALSLAERLMEKRRPFFGGEGGSGEGDSGGSGGCDDSGVSGSGVDSRPAWIHLTRTTNEADLYNQII